MGAKRSKDGGALDGGNYSRDGGRPLMDGKREGCQVGRGGRKEVTDQPWEGEGEVRQARTQQGWR